MRDVIYGRSPSGCILFGIHHGIFFGKHILAAVFLTVSKMGRRLFLQLDEAAELTFTLLCYCTISYTLELFCLKTMLQKKLLKFSVQSVKNVDENMTKIKDFGKAKYGNAQWILGILKMDFFQREILN